MNLFLPFLLLSYFIFCTEASSLCKNPPEFCDYHADYFPNKVEFKHSSTIQDVQFRNTYVDFTLVSNVTGSPFVTFPQTVFKYRLVKCGCDAIRAPKDRMILFTEPKAVYINEGPILGLFEELIPNLRPLAFTGPAQFIFSPRIRNRIKNGKITPVTSTNLSEITNASNLTMSLIGTFSVGPYVVANTRKPFLVVGEISEKTLLGRAEYIKLMGLIFNQVIRATQRFSFVKSQYCALRNIVKKVEEKPSVFYNYPFGDQWSQPGEFQYTVSAVLDAEGSYQFSDDGQLLSRSLSFDEILQNFQNTEVLINSAFFPLSNNATLQQYIDSRSDAEFKEIVTKLDAVKSGNVWSNSLRISPDGMASDFFESAVFRADLLLRDYIKILHPELNSADPFVYMYKYSS